MINSLKRKIKRQQIALALEKFVAIPPRTSFIMEDKGLELTWLSGEKDLSFRVLSMELLATR
jgi:hypothetical protein